MTILTRVCHACLLTLFIVASLSSQVKGQNIAVAGCSAMDAHKVSSLAQGLMGCLHVTFVEVFMFMGRMTSQQKEWLNHCAESSEKYQSECFHLMESLLQEAAYNRGSLPHKLVTTLYDNPPQILNCVANLNNGQDVGSFSPTCTDGIMISQAVRSASRMAPYINNIKPWHYPPAVEGCSITDLLNVELSFLPFIDCLNVNFTSFTEGFGTGGSFGKQLEDATIRAAIDCLYDPTAKNSDCMYLIILASTKLEGGSWSSIIPYAMRALTDYPQACQCVRGISQLSAFKAVPKTCNAHSTLSLLTSLETSCIFEPQIQSALSQALGGCSDAEVVQAELVGIQVLSCMDATGKDFEGTTEALNSARIAMVASCVADPSYTNKDCLALLNSVSKVASNEPDSLEAQFMQKLGKDGAKFCACINDAVQSQPAQLVPPTCETPYKGITFIRENQHYCNALAAVPPSFWSAVTHSIAAAMNSSSSSTSTTTATTITDSSVPVSASTTVKVSNKAEIVDGESEVSAADSENMIKFSGAALPQSRKLRSG